MLYFKHLTRRDIEDALEEILGAERWKSVKNLSQVNVIIKTSDSVYEAAERIGRLLNPESSNSTGQVSE